MRKCCVKEKKDKKQMKEEADEMIKWNNLRITEKTLANLDIVYQYIEQARNLLGENENNVVDILNEALTFFDKAIDEERGRVMIMKGYEDSEYHMSQKLHHFGTISKTIAFALSSEDWYDNTRLYNVWFSEYKEKRRGKKIEKYTVARLDINELFHARTSAETYINQAKDQAKKDPTLEDLYIEGKKKFVY